MSAAPMLKVWIGHWVVVVLSIEGILPAGAERQKEAPGEEYSPGLSQGRQPDKVEAPLELYREAGHSVSSPVSSSK